MTCLLFPSMVTSIEEARRFAEDAGNTEHQAYFEGQRDLIAMLAKEMTRREMYSTEDAVIEGPDAAMLYGGMPFLPIPTPKDRTLWPDY